jgi:hypothetical protein
MAKAGKERRKVSLLIDAATAIKSSELTITNIKTGRGFSFFEGSSLPEVLGFFESISLSRYLLKPIAAFLAVTIAARTSTNKRRENVCVVVDSASTKPIRANGKANTVCENFTRLR